MNDFSGVDPGRLGSNLINTLDDIKLEMAQVYRNLSQATAIEQDLTIDYIISAVAGLADSVLALAELMEKENSG